MRKSSKRQPLKELLIVFAGLVALLFVVFAIYWHEINVMPSVVIPTPAMPKPNAFDTFNTAAKLVRDSDQWNEAAADRPAGFTNSYDPDDHYYPMAIKEKYLSENLLAMAKVREGFPYSYMSTRQRSFSSVMPYLAQFRNLARLFGFASLVESKRGNWKIAVDDGLDAVQIGQMVPLNGGMYERLTGVACSAIGRKKIWSDIDHLNVGQAESASQRLEKLRAIDCPIADTWQQEKWTRQASLLEVLRAPGYPNGALSAYMHLIGMASIQPFMRDLAIANGYRASKRQVMASATKYYDGLIKNANQPHPVLLPDPALPTDWIDILQMTYLEDGPQPNRGRTLAFRTLDNRAQNAMLETALALRAYDLDHGRYPESLSKLAPAYLKAVPTDPFAPRAHLRYRLKGKSYLLYSVGPDGKDDGGKPIYSSGNNAYGIPLKHRVMPDSKGDIVAGVNM
jgi:hypothetical protein